MLSRNFVPELSKRKQIDTLKIFNDHVIEVRENAEYKVKFMAGNNNMILDVILGSDFPNEKPVLLITPMVSHPWITKNTRNITGAPGLLNFTIHSDLGRVVQAIIREFERTPPPIICENSAPGSDSDPGSPQGVSTSSTSATVNSPTQGTPTSTVPGLENLTIEELQHLMNSTDCQNRFIETMPQTIDMEKTINDLMDDIITLAKDNLSKEENIHSLKIGIKERVDTIKEKRINYENLHNEHQKLCQPYFPHMIMASLRTLVEQGDADSELLASNFLDGTIDTDAFLKFYEEKRGLSISQRAREERLSHQLKQLDKAGF